MIITKATTTEESIAINTSLGEMSTIMAVSGTDGLVRLRLRSLGKIS